MRFVARFTVAAAALAFVGGMAATATTASAQDVRVRVGTQKPYYYAPRHAYKYRAPRHVYKYRPPARYYYQPPRRYYAPPRRNFLNCRWVPHRGRVCW